MGNDFEMCGQTVAILGGYLCAINRSQEIQNFVHICKHIYKDVHAKHIHMVIVIVITKLRLLHC